MPRISKLAHLTEEEKKERRRKMALINNWIKWGGTGRSRASEVEERRNGYYTYEQIMRFIEARKESKRRRKLYNDSDDDDY